MSHLSHGSHGSHSSHTNHASTGAIVNTTGPGVHTNTGIAHANSGIINNHSDPNTGAPITLVSPPVRVILKTGSGTWVVPDGVTSVKALVVAGGGGGGSNMGGGGGGGGVIYNAAFGVTPGSSINWTVGVGGAGSPGNQDNSVTPTKGANGGNSVFGSLTAIGGGAGGCGISARGAASGNNGGCGGGASGYNDGPSVFGGLGTPGQGYAGGNQGSAYYSGGGGGAGMAGSSGNNRADGGDGIACDILGTNYYWGGGGGGAGYSTTGGNGGKGGGGGGAVGSTTGGPGYNPGNSGGGGVINAQTNKPGGDGGINTGGGGGGGSHYNYGNKGGNGGSGIIVISYIPPGSNSWSTWAINPGNKISDTTSKIQELANKIEYLRANKGYNTTTNSQGVFVPNNKNIVVDLENKSTDFNDIKIADVQYSQLQTSLNSIYTPIVGSNPPINYNTNMLIDPGFESGFSFWSIYNNGGAAATSSTVAGRTGLKAMQVSFSTSANNTEGIYYTGTRMNFIVGKNYTLSFYAKGTGTFLGYGFQLQWNNHPTSVSWTKNMNLTTDWQEYSVTFSWSNGSPEGRLWIDTLNHAATGSIVFDDINVVLSSVTQTAFVSATDINLLHTSILDLAAIDKSASHASHSSHSNHANHGNHANHTSHANHNSHANHSSHTNHASTSDRRLKKNIKDLNNALDLISKLRPVEYEWKDQSVDKDSYYGFIAQEIEEYFPEWIIEEDGIKRIEIKEFEIEALIIKSIQEQQKILDQLSKKFNIL